MTVSSFQSGEELACLEVLSWDDLALFLVSHPRAGRPGLILKVDAKVPEKEQKHIWLLEAYRQNWNIIISATFC